MQKLQENIHAIQASCKICEEEHLTKEHPLKEDGKVAIDEWIRKFRDDTDMSLRMLDAATKNLQGKAEQLTQEILTNNRNDKAKTKMRSEMKVRKEPVPFDESTMPPSQFPRHLKEQEDEAQAFRMLEGLKRLKINRSLIRAVKGMPEYLMYVKDVFSSKKPIMEKDAMGRLKPQDSHVSSERVERESKSVKQNEEENNTRVLTLPWKP
ncbi:hypothetical protein Tco_0449060 [Tanacetum coccineum]